MKSERARQWVLLRGLAREQGHWGEFKTLLAQTDTEADITCIDSPGCGQYHRLSSPHKIEGIAEFIHSHLKGTKPQKRFIFAISLGGMVAVELLRQYPDSFDGLVIANSSFRNLSPLHHRLQIEGLWHLCRAALAGNDLVAKERAILRMVSGRGDKDQIAEAWAQIAKRHPVSSKNFFKQLFAAATYNLPTSKPSVPVLVLSSHGDHMVNSECSQKLAAKWQAPIELHPNAGHEICLDDPQWVVDQMMGFVDKYPIRSS